MMLRPVACRPPRLPFAGACAIAAIALLSSTAAAQPDPFDVQPYLQHLDTSSVRVRFRTASAVPATVVVQPASGGPAVRFDAPEAKGLRDVFVTGLSAAASYRYFVEVGSARSGPGSFTTAPADPTTPFSFVVYGDCRSNAGDHASVVRAIESTSSDFLLQTGDLVDHGDRDASWRTFFAIEADLLRDRSLFVTVGNHDLDGRIVRARDAYLRWFGTTNDAAARPYFSFRWANTRFFLLDAMDKWDGPQGRWLREQLAASDHEPGVVHRIVAIHHGPYSSGPHGANTRFVEAGMVGLLRRHRVSLVLAGHDHLYERGEVQGLKYVVTGGAGAPLYEVRARVAGSQVALSALHFVQVRVEGQRVELTARSPSGVVLDQCAFVERAPWQCEARAELHPGPVPATDHARRSRCGCDAPGRRAQGTAAWTCVLAVFAAFLGRKSGRPAGVPTSPHDLA